MTSDTTTRNQYHLLERILQKVDSIDDNVERILDQLEGHLDELAYRRDWADHGYDLRPSDDYRNGD